jgi:hypothetical protein
VTKRIFFEKKFFCLFLPPLTVVAKNTTTHLNLVSGPYATIVDVIGIVTFEPMVQFPIVTFFPMMHDGIS